MQKILRLVRSQDFSPLMRAEALTTNLELFTPIYLSDLSTYSLPRQ